MAPKVDARPREVMKTGPARRFLWTVKGHPNVTVVGTKVAEQWIWTREGNGQGEVDWISGVREYVDGKLRSKELPANDRDGDIWYEVNTFTLP